MKPSEEKILRTARLELVAGTLQHIEAEQEDPQLLGQMLGARIPSDWPPGEYDQDALEFFRQCLQDGGAEVVGWYVWYAMTRKQDGSRDTLIAGCGYVGPPADGQIEIGYSVVAEARGQGYAGELVEALVQYAFQESTVDKVIAHTLDTNEPSMRVLEKAGFSEAGTSDEPDTLRFERTRTRAAAPDFLQSQRLVFRPWSRSDLPLALELWGDPEVTQLIGGPFSQRQVEERLQLELATWASHGLQYWPFFLRASGEFLGCCGLRPYQPEVPELGFHLKRIHWGRGFAEEAARAVLTYAFETLGAQAVFAGHNPINDVSRRLLQRIGFEFSHDQFYPPTGLQHPSYLLTESRYWSLNPV